MQRRFINRQPNWQPNARSLSNLTLLKLVTSFRKMLICYMQKSGRLPLAISRYFLPGVILYIKCISIKRPIRDYSFILICENDFECRHAAVYCNRT
jgi:hypothetical protein